MSKLIYIGPDSSVAPIEWLTRTQARANAVNGPSIDLDPTNQRVIEPNIAVKPVAVGLGGKAVVFHGLYYSVINDNGTIINSVNWLNNPVLLQQNGPGTDQILYHDVVKISDTEAIYIAYGLFPPQKAVFPAGTSSAYNRCVKLTLAGNSVSFGPVIEQIGNGKLTGTLGSIVGSGSEMIYMGNNGADVFVATALKTQSSQFVIIQFIKNPHLVSYQTSKYHTNSAQNATTEPAFIGSGFRGIGKMARNYADFKKIFIPLNNVNVSQIREFDLDINTMVAAVTAKSYTLGSATSQETLMYQTPDGTLAVAYQGNGIRLDNNLNLLSGNGSFLSGPGVGYNQGSASFIFNRGGSNSQMIQGMDVYANGQDVITCSGSFSRTIRYSPAGPMAVNAINEGALSPAGTGNVPGVNYRLCKVSDDKLYFFWVTENVGVNKIYGKVINK